jgi:hypothetical protein
VGIANTSTETKKIFGDLAGLGRQARDLWTPARRLIELLASRWTSALLAGLCGHCRHRSQHDALEEICTYC